VALALPRLDLSGRAGYGQGLSFGRRPEGAEPHVGHKVEITGFVDEPAATSGEDTSVTGPIVKVQSVKMIAETCGR
jgi:hypothetical protein